MLEKTAVIPSIQFPVRRVMWDLGQLLSHFKFWFFLAWLEVRQQYRRSSLGPAWITLTTAAYIFTLVFVFGYLFQIRQEMYAPWVALGVITWNFITSCLNEAGTILIAKKQLLMQRQMSHNGLVLASVLKSFVVFLHQIPIYLGVMIFFKIEPTLETLWILVTVPALVILVHPLCLIIAYVSVRMRDVPPLVNAVLTPLFFVTPIMWIPNQLGELAWIAEWNPFSALIGLVREPLLGRPIEMNMVLMAIGTGVVLWATSFLLQILVRRRIMYWA